MDKLVGRIVTEAEVAKLYLEKRNEWFLLEVETVNEHGKAKTLQIINHHRDKGVLRDYILDEDHATGRRFIFFFSDPDQPCDLG